MHVSIRDPYPRPFIYHPIFSPPLSLIAQANSKWCIFLPHLAIASSPPIFEDFPPSRKEANAEDVISLPCRSKPPRVYPTIQDWRKDGKPLLEEDTTSNRITSSGGQLLIKSATREDSGNYTCSLVNSAGNVTSNSSQVIVKGKSHFTDWYLFVYTKVSIFVTDSKYNIILSSFCCCCGSRFLTNVSFMSIDDVVLYGQQ